MKYCRTLLKFITSTSPLINEDPNDNQFCIKHVKSMVQIASPNSSPSICHDPSICTSMVLYIQFSSALNAQLHLAPCIPGKFQIFLKEQCHREGFHEPWELCSLHSEVDIAVTEIQCCYTVSKVQCINTITEGIQYIIFTSVHSVDY